MSLAVLWEDVRETHRLYAHWKRVKREYVAALRAASPRGSPAGRAAFTVLDWLFKGARITFKWAVPAFVAWLGVQDGKVADELVVFAVFIYALAVPGVMGQMFLPESEFSVVRFPSRVALLAFNFARRFAVLFWWGAITAVFVGRLGATPYLIAACGAAPIVVALVGMDATMRKRIHDPLLRAPYLAVPFLLLAAVAVVCWVATFVGYPERRIIAEAALCAATTVIGLASAHSAFGHIALADVPRRGEGPEPERPLRRKASSLRATRNAAAPSASPAPFAPSAPGAGLLRAHWGTLSAGWSSMTGRERIVACALGAIWLLGAPVGTVLGGPTATNFEFSTVFIGVYTVFLKDLFAVRHPSRLALYGVAPRTLRLYGLGSFLLAVALPVALGAAGSLAWLGTPSPLWLRLYGGVAAVFVLRMGWDGFEIMGRDEGAARRWSLPLRLLAIAAFVAIPTSVGALPCAVLGVVGLAWLLTHLDAPVWDSDGEDRAVRLRRS